MRQGDALETQFHQQEASVADGRHARLSFENRGDLGPDLLVHHGVGSEGWSADGFTKPA